MSLELRPMHRHLAAIILLTFSAFHVALGQPSPCTETQHRQVEIEAVNLRTWDALYSSYRKYKHCGDVEAAEGYSESKARILADHWETLPRLAQLIEKDKSFGKFVALDATMNMADVAKIKELATTRCPTGLSKLCAKLNKDAEEAIAEDTSSRK